MCIRDRYQRRVRGLLLATMALQTRILMLAMFVGVSNATEVATLDEGATDITYRVSWTCSKHTTVGTTSQGIFTIQFTGPKGTTTAKTLAVNPCQTCTAKGDVSACYTSNTGVVPSDESRGAATCPCDPTLHSGVEFDEKKWTRDPGQHRQMFIVAEDVGDLTKVEITSTSSRSKTGVWDLLGLRVNTNSQKTGLGNGVFYVKGKQISPSEALDGALCGKTSETSNPSPGCLVGCNAQVCEEEMNALLGF
eukprot:TRINITY_DN15917_c0_g1_i1.p1 TRINITY_DN15917_c0_g1~~TRINITY_DN15917_c0_g1_i1.p1  ORF type:complete len:250 (+),score=53.36 TRINITY_DN15917_c0_g1_i1:181-930(+)